MNDNKEDENYNNDLELWFKSHENGIKLLKSSISHDKEDVILLKKNIQLETERLKFAEAYLEENIILHPEIAKKALNM